MSLRAHKRAYWLCQFGGWGSYTASLVYSLYNFVPQEAFHIKLIILQFVIGGSALLISLFVRNYIKRHKWADLSPKKLLPRALLLNVIAAISSNTLIHIIMLTVLDWTSYRPIEWRNFPFYTLNLFGVFIIWSLFYFGYHYFASSRKEKMDKLKAEAALKDAELIALKAQVNPHFLFNALNNIRALILEDAMKARDMVSNLSDMLRYSVDFSRQEKVALREEIEVVENYLQLETVHYDNRLEYRIEIDDQTLEKMIPPMIIQLMVENAVKHGISKVQGGGEIRISTGLEDDTLLIMVENTGELLHDKSERNGIGIQNALDRIRLLFDVEPNFHLQQQGKDVVATLRLPATS